MCESDYSAQVQYRTRSVRELHVHFMQQLIEMSHQVNPYVQTFKRLGEWVVGHQAPMHYQMLIHAERIPTSQHVRLYNRTSGSEVPSIVPVVKMESPLDEM